MQTKDLRSLLIVGLLILLLTQRHQVDRLCNSHNLRNLRNLHVKACKITIIVILIREVVQHPIIIIHVPPLVQVDMIDMIEELLTPLIPLRATLPQGVLITPLRTTLPQGVPLTHHLVILLQGVPHTPHQVTLHRDVLHTPHQVTLHQGVLHTHHQVQVKEVQGHQVVAGHQDVRDNILFLIN